MSTRVFKSMRSLQSEPPGVKAVESVLDLMRQAVESRCVHSVLKSSFHCFDSLVYWLQFPGEGSSYIYSYSFNQHNDTACHCNSTCRPHADRDAISRAAHHCSCGRDDIHPDQCACCALYGQQCAGNHPCQYKGGNYWKGSGGSLVADQFPAGSRWQRLGDRAIHHHDRHAGRPDR